MTKQWLAHVSEDGRVQTVEEHLQGTARLCGAFAGEFGAEAQGKLAGLAHDIGKYSVAFQYRLLENGPRVDHSTAGAKECYDRNQLFASFCIAGHHSGLPDLGNRTDSDSCATLKGRICRAKNNKIPDYSGWAGKTTLPNTPMPREYARFPEDADFFTRMLYSCLTDADFIDTEAFMSNGQVQRGGCEASVLCERFDRFVKGWFPPKGELNRQRCAILSRCMECGEEEGGSGLYTLTVPTGGGKTMASMGFALHHAKKQGAKRVIYVIPYTSIIEQTAKTFRDVFGEENVLEHHSNVLLPENDEATEQTIRLAMATENWDMPIIVTTAVQFFESIYGNRSSKCRKLHNIANSVIIFDEAQMMPFPYLRPCVSAIAQLVRHYGVTAVLCTATQPSLDGLFAQYAQGLPIREICPAGTYDPELFRRVTFRKGGSMTWEQVASKMKAQTQVLCVVNTRKAAKTLFDLLKNEEGTYHLSTLMVPAHRRAALEEIRQRLREGKPCRVVSTSLIEAGVDVDFGTVYREIAGLDSVLQAAGRCNREGKRDPNTSIVTVFISPDRVPPLFERNATIGQTIIEQNECFWDEKAIKSYFDMLMTLATEEEQDKKGVMENIKLLAFETIAKNFHLIDKNTVTVYVPWQDGEGFMEHLKAGERSRTLFRRAAQYSVALYENAFQNLEESGYIQNFSSEKGEELWLLTNMELYDEKTGIRLNAESGNALFA